MWNLLPIAGWAHVYINKKKSKDIKQNSKQFEKDAIDKMSDITKIKTTLIFV